MYKPDAHDDGEIIEESYKEKEVEAEDGVLLEATQSSPLK